MSELRVVERAELTPQTCTRCSNHLGPFVDLGASRPDTGRLYLCSTCCGSLAGFEDYAGLSPDELVAAEGQLAAALEDERALRAALEQAEREQQADGFVLVDAQGLP